jgi:chaperonin GroEL
MIGDMKQILGPTSICQKVVVTKDTTTFIGCQSDCDFNETIQGIENIIQRGNLSEPELLFQNKRLANFAGGICTIKVGGFSEVEIKEKKDRIEDAICATKAALEGGVLPGGGKALYMASELNDLHFKNYLKEPMRILLKHKDLFPVNVTDFWVGCNIKTNTPLANLYEEGVIDPFLVTKTALENAVSAASLILTNGCSIIYDK